MKKMIVSFLVAVLIATTAIFPVHANVQAAPSQAPSPDADLARMIDSYLKGKKSPLAGYGSAFVKSGRQYNVDPRLIVAIAGAESSFGKATCQKWKSVDIHNAWGYFNSKGECANFKTWEEGIDAVSWQIGEVKDKAFCYLKCGLTTIEKIGARYCADGCENWVPNTKAIFQELDGYTASLFYPVCKGRNTGNGSKSIKANSTSDFIYYSPCKQGSNSISFSASKDGVSMEACWKRSVDADSKWQCWTTETVTVASKSLTLWSGSPEIDYRFRFKTKAISGPSITYNWKFTTAK